MRMCWHRRVSLWVACVLLGLSARAAAAERVVDFLEALRKADYHDYALHYLDRLEQRGDVPAEIRQQLPFERAITLIDAAQSSRDPEAKNRQLDQAREYLEAFVRAAPNHPKAGQANAELAQVYRGKAEAAVLMAAAPGNAARKDELRRQARGLYAEARKVFDQAHKRYAAEYEKFDKFIPESDKARHAAREKAYVNLINAQLNLARLKHDEAQTYDKGTPENRKLLIEAANAFQSIHDHYRTMVPGLHARMWQGKCFEEMEDLTKAMGIYNELLGHSSKQGGYLDELQAQVLQFKLICLNHPSRQDYQVVIDTAEEWLKANRAEQNSRVGLGIQWQMLLAIEQKARKEETAEADRRRLLQQALDGARRINRYAGAYKEPSTAMIRRISASLGRGTGAPKDFTTAYSLAKLQIDEVRTRSKQIAEAKGSERQRLSSELVPVAREAVHLLTEALALAGPKDDINEVNRARYFLAYAYYTLRDHSYHAAVLAEFVARKYHATQPEIALEAAYLAQAAYIQAYNREPKERRGAEIAWLIDTCEFLARHWPESDKAQEARIQLGGLYAELGQPDEAAKWYLSVPESSPLFLEAQLHAGNAFWNMFVAESTRPEAERKPRSEIEGHVGRAQTILQQAISRYEAQLPKEVSQIEAARLRHLASAKTTLAMILNGSGDYRGALALLVDGPLAALNALRAFAADERQHREFGIRARIQALRAYIGLSELAKAQAMQRELDASVAGTSGGSAAALTQVYVQFGGELKKEVQRLQAARDPRLAEVLRSFETFLEEVAKRQEGQDYASLRWIAETYRDLGEGVGAAEPTKAQRYFGKAVGTFRAILDAAQRNASFLPTGHAAYVQLQVVRCLRLSGAFDEAEAGVVAILKERPRALDAQFEAAQIYHDRAARAGADDLKYWGLAIEGDQNLKKRPPEDRVIWGWFGIGQRLENSLNQPGAKEDDLEGKYFDARYNVAQARWQWALAQSSADKKRALLSKAYRDVLVTSTLNPSLGGEENWKRFNALYRDIQKEMLALGKFDELANRAQPADLDKPRPREVAAKKGPRRKPAPAAASQAPAAASQAPAAASQARQGGGTLQAVLLVAVLVGGGAAATWLVLRKPARRRVYDVTLSPPQPPRPAAKVKRA